jgi:2-iminoacetate synthase ThiH
MAVIDRTESLARIREKVEANEPLGADEREELRSSDDLLALGELAELARCVRGGSDEVTFCLGAAAAADVRERTGSEELKALALARILGDSGRVTADATVLGLPLAGVALHFGADDVAAPADLDRGELVRTIAAAGRVPVERRW